MSIIDYELEQSVNTAKLTDEILSGPLSTELAPMVAIGDDVGVANALNRKDIITGKQVETWQVKKLLIKRGKWREILAACAANNTAACVVVDLAEDPRMTIDLHDPEAAVILTGLKVSGLLDDILVSELQALSADITSRAKIMWGGEVTHLDVAKALRSLRGW